MSAARIAFTDKIEFANALQWRQVGESVITAHPQVIVDFTAMTGYTSALLAVLLAYKRLAQRQHCELQWFAAPESLLRLATIYNVRTLLGM